MQINFKTMEETPDYKTKPKENNVKRTFFYEGEVIPTYEMEDGTIRRAYFMNSQQGVKTLWYSEAEFNLFKKAAEDKKNKPKILDMNGNKMKGN